MDSFDRALDRLNLYAFFSGKIRGIELGVSRKYYTPERGIELLREAIAELDHRLEEHDHKGKVAS